MDLGGPLGNNFFIWPCDLEMSRSSGQVQGHAAKLLVSKSCVRDYHIRNYTTNDIILLNVQYSSGDYMVLSKNLFKKKPTQNKLEKIVSDFLSWK